MTKLIGSETPLDTRIGEVTQGLGFELLQVEGDNVSAGEILIAESVATQNPSGTDTPLQIEFGALQTTDDIDIDASGTITVKTAGTYLAFITMYFTRTSSVGETHFFVRLLQDSVQLGNPIGIVQTDDDVTIPLFLSSLIAVSENELPTVFTVEAVRDSSGINNGGLIGLSSSIGWGQTPSARVRIIKF